MTDKGFWPAATTINDLMWLVHTVEINRPTTSPISHIDGE
jgi:hypothetical protein